MKNKEYENIYAKMLCQHNDETVPFLKSIKSGSINIKWRKVKLALDRLEEGKVRWIGSDYLHEYLLMNKFVIQFLNQEEYNNSLELVNAKGDDNRLIGAHCLYSLIEAKKLEIMEKLK